MLKVTKKYFSLAFIFLLSLSLMVNLYAFSKSDMNIHDFEISPDGNEMYVLDEDDTYFFSVYIIDAITEQIKKVIPIKKDLYSDPHPYTMVMAQDGKSLYIAAHTEIIKIDTTSKKIASIISTANKNSMAESIAITPDGTKVFSADNAVLPLDANDDAHTYIHVIDTQRNTLIQSIPKNDEPHFLQHGFTSIAIDHSGNKAYLLDEINQKIAVLDLLTNHLQLKAIPNNHEIDLTDIVGRMAINSSDNLLYVSERPGNAASVAVIDLNTYDRIDRINFEGIYARDITILPDNRKIYVISDPQFTSGSLVTVINTRTKQVLKQIKLKLKGSSSGFLHMTQDGKKVYAAPQGSNLIFIIDTVSDQIVKTYDLQRDNST